MAAGLTGGLLLATASVGAATWVTTRAIQRRLLPLLILLAGLSIAALVASPEVRQWIA